MDLFGKKKEDVSRELQEIKKAVDVPLPTREDLERAGRPAPVQERPVPVQERPVETPREEEPMQERQKPAAAPVFIKLDRYHVILTSMSEIRRGLETIKNVFSYISEMEKMKSESFRMLHDVVAKIDKKLTYLDSEFLRPPGFEAPETQTMLEPSSLEDVIVKMKGKIDELRSQIEGM